MVAGNTRARCVFITTPESANLPASASEKNFPLPVRLKKNFFDFSQAKPQGEDIWRAARNLFLAKSTETGVWPKIWGGKELIL